MNQKLQQKILDLTVNLVDCPVGKNKHLTFFVKRNKIVSVGWNDYYTTHPLCQKLGYRYSAVHSEISALLRYRGSLDDLHTCSIVNTRINSKLQLGMSRPCEICEQWIQAIGFRDIYYTDRDGNFQKIVFSKANQLAQVYKNIILGRH